MASDLPIIEQRLDDMAIPFLIPMRMTKEVDRELLTNLLQLGDDLVDAISGLETVPRSLVGKAWMFFTTMLAEADHTKTPEQLLDAAWQWEEKLRRAFGPNL